MDWVHVSVTDEALFHLYSSNRSLLQKDWWLIQSSNDPRGHWSWIWNGCGQEWYYWQSKKLHLFRLMVMHWRDVRMRIPSPYVMPFMNCHSATIFMQDNTPPHRACVTTWFLATAILAILSWPAILPDVNNKAHLGNHEARSEKKTKDVQFKETV